MSVSRTIVALLSLGRISTDSTQPRCARVGVAASRTRFGSPTPNRDAVGDIGAMALYAGHSVDAVRRVQPAAEIVRELSEGAERLLRACASSYETT